MKFRYPLLVLVILMTTSCAQLSKFQTARTSGKGNITGGATASVFILNDEESILDEDAGVFPFGLVYAYYGLGDRVDFGLSLSSSGSAHLSMKLLTIGSNESPFALSIEPGMEFQTDFDFTDGESVYRPHLGLIGSYHFKNKNAIFFEPRVIGQFVDGDQDLFYGLTGGYKFHLDEKSGLNIGASFYTFTEGGESWNFGTNISQLGISYIRRFSLSNSEK